LVNTITFEPTDEPQLVWSTGDVRVSAIRSTHIAGHVSYRADTPAGSVVIGGDAGNDVLAPPRNSSTSEQVERIAKGANIIDTSHPTHRSRRAISLKVPGNPLTEEDYRKAAQDGGFTGDIIVGTDLASLITQLEWIKPRRRAQHVFPRNRRRAAVVPAPDHKRSPALFEVRELG
jgi:ribonuclease Z